MLDQRKGPTAISERSPELFNDFLPGSIEPGSVPAIVADGVVVEEQPAGYAQSSICSM